MDVGDLSMNKVTKIEGNGHWQSKVAIDKEKNIGFVYLISHKDSKAIYIGKKLYYNKVGKKKKEKWQTYTSSSKELNSLIEKYGKDRFNFLIIDQADSKSLLSYKELLAQIHYNAAFDKNCLNGILNLRINLKCLKGKL
jgi:hypothetical protein